MATETEATAEVDVRALAVRDIVPSPENPRKLFPKAGMEEIAQTMQEVGVLQPLLVRPHPEREDFFDLVAGERRLRAARLAGLETVPCLVRELNDEEATRIRVIENLQREDLTPFEESEAIRGLEAKGWSVQDIAERLGKSPSWVARRAALGKLTPKWRAAVLGERPARKVRTVEEKRKMVQNALNQAEEDGEGQADDVSLFTLAQLEEAFEDIFGDLLEAEKREAEEEYPDLSEWPAGHLEMIARLPADVQDDLLGWHHGYRIPTSAQLREDIEREVRLMSAAPWKQDDALADRTPCAECMLRSDRQPTLFEDMLASNKYGHCLSPACWKAKMAAWIAGKVRALVEEHGKTGVVFVRGSGYRPRGEAPVELPAGAKPVYEWSVTEVAPGPKAMPALVVEGHDAGKLYFVSKRSQSSGASSRPKGRKSMAEKRKELEGRRAKLLVEKLAEQLVGKDFATAPRGCEEMACLAAVFGTARDCKSRGYSYDSDGKRRKPWEDLEQLLASPDEADVAQALWDQVRPVLKSRLTVLNGEDALGALPEAEALCGYLGLDYAAMVALAEAAIPEPKSWAKTKAKEAAASTSTRTSRKKGAKGKAKGASKKKPAGKRRAKG